MGLFFKIFSILIILLVVGSIVFSYYIIKDANNFKNNFTNSSNLFLMKQKVNGTDSLLAGVTINPNNKAFQSLNKESIDNLQKMYTEGKLQLMEKDYYKIFVIDIKSLDNISLYNITDRNVQLTKEETKRVLSSSNAREEFSSIVAAKQGTDKNSVLKTLSASNEELKGYLFSYYLSTVFNPKNMGEFLLQLKNDNIKVYDETALFTAIKLVPKSLIDKLI